MAAPSDKKPTTPPVGPYQAYQQNRDNPELWDVLGEQHLSLVDAAAVMRDHLEAARHNGRFMRGMILDARQNVVDYLGTSYFIHDPTGEQTDNPWRPKIVAPPRVEVADPERVAAGIKAAAGQRGVNVILDDGLEDLQRKLEEAEREEDEDEDAPRSSSSSRSSSDLLLDVESLVDAAVKLVKAGLHDQARRLAELAVLVAIRAAREA